jgi:hypothetical protein
MVVKMREVRFRGKWDHNLWKYGSLVTLNNNSSSEPYYQIVNAEGHFHVDTKTIGQFTGLYDVDGKEIYEGDILEYGDGIRCDVMWDADNHPYAAAFITRDANRFVGAYPLNLYWVEKKLPKVIGNIHDNPELLNSKEQ